MLNKSEKLIDPFGRAVTGKKVGENFTMDIKGEEVKFTVTSIKKISSE